jgi:hypothetical protein
MEPNFNGKTSNNKKIPETSINSFKRLIDGLCILLFELGGHHA